MNRLPRYLAASSLVLATACAAPIADPGSEEALEGTHSEALFWGCDTERLIENAPTWERRQILVRAARWVDDPKPYSQTTWSNGYRQDCSGFVAMAWGVSGSMWTGDLPPRTTSRAYAYEIEWGEMLPGDAVARGPRVSWEDGHVRLYAGDGYLGDPCYWEQTSFGIVEAAGTQTNFHTAAVMAPQGYVPIRRSDL
jgi:hypothetical protein